MAREDWEHLFRVAPAQAPNCFEAEAFDGMELFDDGLEAPARAIFALLKISPQHFLDILNTPRTSPEHLMTNKEREFRAAPEGTEFFTREMIFDSGAVTVHKEDFKAWLDVGNYRLLRAWTIYEREVKCFEQILDEQGWEEELKEVEGAENAELKNAAEKGAEVAELASLPKQNSEEKQLAKREKNTLLKLIHAAVELGGKRSISDRGLAGKLARKSQELYPDAPVSESTVKNKINDIKELGE